MDALLAEALGDFEEDVADARQQQKPAQAASQLGPPPCSEPEPCTQGQDLLSVAPAGAAPVLAGPKGPTLPPRVSKTPAAAAATSTATTTAGAPPASRPIGVPQLPARTKKQQKEAEQQPVLRPEVQQLAEDIMRLMEESGLDLSGSDAAGGAGAEGMGTGGLPDASQFTSPALRDLAERALQAVEAEAAAAAATAGASAGAGSSGAGPGPSGQPQFRSAALRGLADLTKQTVQEQSKVSRGEGTGSAASSSASGARPQQAAAGPGGLFGDLLGMMNASGQAEGGAPGGPGGGMGIMVDYIMQNLLSKEVLYGPLKDIRDKYPPWLEANKATLPPADVQRYTAQFASIQAVCRQYEEDPSNFQRLVDLIQEMQTYGDPPSAIVDQMMPGEGLMGATGDPEDIGNFDMPEMEDLPKELKDKCPIQ